MNFKIWIVFLASPLQIEDIWTWNILQWIPGKYRYEEAETDYNKYLELKPGNAAIEKELSQLHQARSALQTASNLFDSGDFEKALEYIDKVVLVFSPACSKVAFFSSIICYLS